MKVASDETTQSKVVLLIFKNRQMIISQNVTFEGDFAMICTRELK